MKRLLFCIGAFFPIALLLTGCGPTRYSMKEPEFKDIQITGLGPDNEIVEATDVYNNQSAGDNAGWLVMKQGKQYQVGILDIATGSVSNLQPLDTYSPDKPLYWTKLTENKMSGGSKCLGACMSQTAFGGTTEDYSFIAEKYFWGNDQHRVHLEYSLKKSASASFGSTSTSTETGGRLKFLQGDNTMEPLSIYGHQDIFATNSNVLKSRYYPIGEKQYLSVQPEEPRGASRIAIIYFDLGSEKSSWGAQYSIPERYVDCCISKDGKIIEVIMGKEGRYTLRRYTQESINPNVKALEK